MKGKNEGCASHIILDLQRRHRQEEKLRQYYDYIGEQLLRAVPENRRAIKQLLRARTLGVLRNLNAERKGHVVCFLVEGRLITRHLLDRRPSPQPKYARGFVDLKDADLRDAQFHNAVLYLSDFRDCDLRRANLRSANMSECDLMRADLRGADLAGASLVDAFMPASDLRGANLTEAKFTIESELTDKRWEPNMIGAKYNSETKADVDLSQFGAVRLEDGEGPDLIRRLKSLLKLLREW